MLGEIERVLALHGVDPRRLVIEVTETASISDMPRASEFLRGAQATRLRHRARRLRRRLRLLPLPQAPALQLPEDRRRLHPWAAPLCARPARRKGARRARPRDGTADDRRVRRRPETLELLREYGVDYAQGFEIGRPGADARRLAGLRELGAHGRVPQAVGHHPAHGDRDLGGRGDRDAGRGVAALERSLDHLATRSGPRRTASSGRRRRLW